MHDDPGVVWDAILDIWPDVPDAAVVRAVDVAQELMKADLAMTREAYCV